MKQRTDALRALTAARPAQLEPENDPLRRERDLAAAFAQPRPADGRRHPRVPRWSGRRGLVAASGAAVVAVAIGATTLVSATTAGVDAGPAVPGDVATAHSAPALLLAAAARTETATATVGRYWLAERQLGHLTQVGPTDDRYVLQLRGRRDHWMSTVPADPMGLVEQHVGAAPATAADEAAWKRAGSPAEWWLDGQDNQSRREPPLRRDGTRPGPAASRPPGSGATKDTDRRPIGIKLTAGPGTQRSFVLPNQPGWSFVTGGKGLTTDEFLALPTEPGALRRVILALRPAGSDADDTTWLFEAGHQLLMGLPVSPKVRGAAYRMLSDLPGVRALGPMDDPSGRRGQAIAMTEQYPGTLAVTGPVEVILVFDPATGSTLATMRRLLRPHGHAAWATPGTIWSYDLLISAGWTTATPPPNNLRTK
ncbi:MAG TPA: CU044_5270 family protein [Catenuloplanes sp.]|jgi:hypothetical protein